MHPHEDWGAEIGRGGRALGPSPLVPSGRDYAKAKAKPVSSQMVYNSEDWPKSSDIEGGYRWKIFCTSMYWRVPTILSCHLPHGMTWSRIRTIILLSHLIITLLSSIFVFLLTNLHIRSSLHLRPHTVPLLLNDTYYLPYKLKGRLHPPISLLSHHFPPLLVFLDSCHLAPSTFSSSPPHSSAYFYALFPWTFLTFFLSHSFSCAFARTANFDLHIIHAWPLETIP